MAHSPPLPLVIDYSFPDRDVSAEEEGIILALEQRDRVRRIHLEVPLPNLQKLIVAIDEEYSILEHLFIMLPLWNEDTVLKLPQTLQAPNLRGLVLGCISLPIRSRLLTTAVGLVTLARKVSHPSAYFQPNILLQWLSSMPQLEIVLIAFSFPVPNRDVERQLMDTPITTHVTLPNLRSFGFQGVSAYMEAVVRRITSPHLKKFFIQFFKQLTFSVPRLVQFINTIENLRFDRAKFEFSDYGVGVEVYSREQAEKSPLQMLVHCSHLDWQVSSMAQIFNSLIQISSTVEHLTLRHKTHWQSSEEHNAIDRTEWRELLRLFSNVKALDVDDGLVGELSRSLRLDDGELPLEILPELQELTYSGRGNMFKPFIDARQDAGRPVSLTRR